MDHPPSPPQERIASLDQFRGYTMAGMFLVNFVGAFAACPRILRHTNDYCSYADTIMPQFLFAVGFAFRLTFERRVRREGTRAAYSRVVRRLVGLAALAFVLYVVIPKAFSPRGVIAEFTEGRGEQFVIATLKRDWFQTLLHIAATSLWILPVIRLSAAARIAFAIISAALHVALSAWFYFEWVHTPPSGIDGGPLGFLTWSLPAITGTLACDLVLSHRSSSLGRMLALGGTLMVAGWILSCGTRLYDVRAISEQAQQPANRLAASPVVPDVESWKGRSLHKLAAEPPFIPPPGPSARRWNYWMMSQRAGTLSYLTFASGLSLAVFAIFFLACDRFAWRSRLLQTFGTNALAGYVIHDPIGRLIRSFTSPEASPASMWTAWVVSMVVIWAILRLLERRHIFFRV